MSALGIVQERFVRRVLGGSGEAPDLRDPVHAAPGTGLGIYVEAYALRLLEALRNDYPGLLRLVGALDFERLGRAYIAAHPSRHFNLRWYARDLAEFLRRQEPWRARAALADLAAFEWAEGEAFDAADAAALDAVALAAIPAEAWSGLRFDFHPSLRRIDVATDVAAWIAASEADPGAPPPAPDAAAWIFWRRDLAILRRRVDEAEAAALALAMSGRGFGDICECLARMLGEAEAPMRAAGLLRVWLDAGMIVGLREA
jgi:hypothetical protein